LGWKIYDAVLGKLALMTGIDSPVSMASFIITLPESKIKSQGKMVYSGTLMTSPGTS
jgi:hypothetical protein